MHDMHNYVITLNDQMLTMYFIISPNIVMLCFVFAKESASDPQNDPNKQ